MAESVDELIFEVDPPNALSPNLFNGDDHATPRLKSILEKVRIQFEHFKAPFKILGVYIIGSHARGNFSQNSDLDIYLHLDGIDYRTGRDIEELMIMQLNNLHFLINQNSERINEQLKLKGKNIDTADLSDICLILNIFGVIKKEEMIEIWVGRKEPSGVVYDGLNDRWLEICKY